MLFFSFKKNQGLGWYDLFLENTFWLLRILIFGSKCLQITNLKTYQSYQMAIINKMDNNKCGPGCGEVETLINCGWK